MEKILRYLKKTPLLSSLFKRKAYRKRSHSRVDTYFHVFHKPKHGKARAFKVHKAIPFSLVILLIIFGITIVSISKYCMNLNHSIAVLEKQNMSNQNLKGEVEALSNKIKNVESIMNQVESLSSKIKKASIRVDDRANNQQKTQVGSTNQIGNFGNNTVNTDALGIGPLSKEDYELSKQLTGIKKDHLQLKNLFDEVASSELESSQKLIDFKKLMAELSKYNIKLQFLPDLSPTRGRVSSLYGWRVSPFTGKEKMHFGLDIAAPIGSPIYATAEGVVVRTALTPDYGRMLEIQHTPKLLTRYGHTSMIYVKEGQHVKKGQIIAAVGSTGRSTGPHVHYEIEVSGKRVDPETYIVLW